MADRNFDAELNGLLEVCKNHSALLEPQERANVEPPRMTVEARWITSEEVERRTDNHAHS